ncbi:fumarylacetoacetate hydrolase family protein [Pseudooceanicola nanhaiensis]|uniref:fumarylacetoacetate hydrolase family protein n=1 Tax=Pseudooceanicola nanhaiensis TaxID=375761 RepID=UPI001CD6A30F|nr:fumarylacetoacetate hydrolase family protein [Pseudooceanicola nanhaiensis]MCA0920483.1 fumarylacetoacetate hydrolase family protein [Pseudooceanicola nanhaiensis]
MAMSLFDLPPIPDIPVLGEGEGYPVRRIFCVGRNYAAHAAEMGYEVDRESPFYFTKSPANMVLTGAATPYPGGTEDYHFEIELAVAMGAEVFQCTPEEGAAAVYGYCAALDMTRRDLQIRERTKLRPWSLGKDVEQSAVFAPITKAADFTPGAQRIWLDQNGETKQDSTLDLLVHKVPEIIAHLSTFYHLRPGDLIMTGTPENVGPVQPGDVLEAGVEGLSPISLTITEMA